MASKTGKTYANTYPNDLAVNQSSGVGIDSTTRLIHDGLGQSTAISLSDDVLSVQPITHNTAGAFIVKNKGGTTILSVDTVSSVVKCGTSQINSLTMYKEFNVHKMVPVAGSHMVLTPPASQNSAYIAEWDLGNSANPSTTVDISGETVDSYNGVAGYWYLPDAITLDAVHILMGGEDATDNTLNFHLTSYALDTSSNYGDLSDGTVVADSGTTTIDEDVIKLTTMTNLPTDVAAGRIILATVETTTTDEISVNMTVKYHIQ